jgi:hypothetical protein
MAANDRSAAPCARRHTPTAITAIQELQPVSHGFGIQGSPEPQKAAHDLTQRKPLLFCDDDPA